MILKNVAELVNGKELAQVSSSDTVENACKIMASANARAVAVVDNGEMQGIVTEKDVVHKCVAAGKEVSSCKVSDVMTANVQSVASTETVAHAIEKMAEGNFHHLPVMNDKQVIGMIYSDDIPEEYKLLLEHYKELRG